MHCTVNIMPAGIDALVDISFFCVTITSIFNPDFTELQDHDNQYNIIHMIEYFYFRNHLCITFELMG